MTSGGGVLTNTVTYSQGVADIVMRTLKKINYCATLPAYTVRVVDCFVLVFNTRTMTILPGKVYSHMCAWYTPRVVHPAG